jgi:uncharacterized LabA/DUF88 family protein
MERVIAYVDGFNLYFGLKDSGLQKYYWLNIQTLAQNLLKPNQELEFVKYFTAMVSNPPDKVKRQRTFIEALETLPNFAIYYGKYQLNPRYCKNCGFTDYVPNEKMTDVNIAVELLADAFQGKFDTAVLISADSDLTGPVRALRNLFPAKKVIVAFPPKRFSTELQKVSNGYFTIGKTKFAHSLFPEEVVKADGYVLKCPESWK